MYSELLPTESVLVGQWVRVGNRVEGDATCERIHWLTGTRLEKMGADASGWGRLYRDPRDRRLWQLTYPHSEMHGGGPPRLEHLTKDEAAEKYLDLVT